MQEPMHLEWSIEAIENFEIKLCPYFKHTCCSVYNCHEAANYECQYSLKNKEYSHHMRKCVYPEKSQRKFYLCQEHANTQYVDLDYDSTRVIIMDNYN